MASLKMTGNFLQSIEFQFSIKRLETVNYFVQNINIPGISLNDVEQPNNQGGRIYHHGNKLITDELNLQFAVDEDMENWMEIYGWMIGVTAPQFAKQYTALETGPGVYSDASLIISSNSKNPLHQFTFTNVFPKSLSSIEFDTTQRGFNARKATASFRFDYFTYKNLRKDK